MDRREESARFGSLPSSTSWNLSSSSSQFYCANQSPPFLPKIISKSSANQSPFFSPKSHPSRLSVSSGKACYGTHTTIEGLRFFSNKKNIVPIYFDLGPEDCLVRDIIEKRREMWEKHGGEFWLVYQGLEKESSDAVSSLSRVDEWKLEAQDRKWRDCILRSVTLLALRLGRRSVVDRLTKWREKAEKEEFPFLHNEDDDFKDMISNIFAEVEKSNLVDCYPFLEWFDPHGIKRQSKVYFEQMFKICGEMIDERLKMRKTLDDKEYHDMLDILLNLCGENIGKEDLRK